MSLRKHVIASEYVMGSSEAARRFDAELAQVAHGRVTVLIEGESGAGKGAAARRLHALSPCSAGPFVEVALAALAPTLIEAELFGHEEGAFTGAHRARRGRFQSAQGGTLLLDGIETLSESVQVKLLRALQERVVEPLGGEPVAIDARVVATSTRELAGEVAARRFREDLYYRLAVVTLRVPPLRSRREDLPELVEAIVARVARRAGVAARSFSPAALARLDAHAWPGNLRELENAIERVLVLGLSAQDEQPPPVAPEELEFLGQGLPEEAARIARDALAQGLSIEDVGRAMIEEALREQRGNASAAARQLGLSRRALEYRRRQSSSSADGSAAVDVEHDAAHESEA